MSEMAKKLGIKAGHRICLLGAAGESAAAVRAASEGSASLTEKLEEGSYDLIFTWVLKRVDLADHFAELQRRIKAQGAIWAVMPKKKYAAQRGVDFTWDELQTAGLQTDLVDNKVAALSEEDYGTRFVIRKERRHQEGAQ